MNAKKTIRQKVRHLLQHLGMQAKTKDFVDELGKSGVSVTVDFVEEIRFGELKRQEQPRRSSAIYRVFKPQRIPKIPQKRPRRE